MGSQVNKLKRSLWWGGNPIGSGTPGPVDRQTDTTENITFPQIPLKGGNNRQKMTDSVYYDYIGPFW